MVNLFSTCPVMPWGPDAYNAVPACKDTGWLGLQGYLSLWTLYALLHKDKTLELLAYLGYSYFAGEDSQITAFTPTRYK